MVKHIILWQLKDELSTEEKENIKSEIKCGLEALVGKIDGLNKLEIITNGLTSSNADAMLYSEFDNEEALKAYAQNPNHVAVASTKVRPFIKSRTCIDYEA